MTKARRKGPPASQGAIKLKLKHDLNPDFQRIRSIVRRLETNYGIAIDQAALEQAVREHRLGRQKVGHSAMEALSEIDASRKALTSHLRKSHLLRPSLRTALVAGLTVIAWFASLTVRHRIAAADAQKKIVTARNLGVRFRGYTPAVNDFILTEVTRIRNVRPELTERTACRYVGGYLALADIVPPASYEANVLS